MHFTASVPPLVPPPLSSLPVEVPSSRNLKMRNRHSLVPPGILSLISKTGTLVSRAASIRPLRPRSFDQIRGTISDRPITQMAEGSSQFSLASGPDRKNTNIERPLAAALKQAEQTSEFLSTSIGVSFKPPSLLARLAEEEQNGPPLYLKGDEKAGLHSLLGWDSKRTRWKAMTGIPGFTRHQTFSVLRSRHIPIVQPSLPTPSSETSSSSVHSSTVLHQSSAAPPKCALPQLMTFQHYSRTADQSLGEAIMELCNQADESCETPGCRVKKSQHEQRFIHDGIMITAKVSPCDAGSEEAQDELGLWLSCAICNSRTKRNDITDGT